MFLTTFDKAHCERDHHDRGRQVRGQITNCGIHGLRLHEARFADHGNGLEQVRANQDPAVGIDLPLMPVFAARTR